MYCNNLDLASSCSCCPYSRLLWINKIPLLFSNKLAAAIVFGRLYPYVCPRSTLIAARKVKDHYSYAALFIH